MTSTEPLLERPTAAAYRIPTDGPEADGTISWDSTTMVIVEARAGDVVGLGYTYAHASAADLVRGQLADIVEGRSAFDIPAHQVRMVAAVRNIGWPGVIACAISALDIALWDLKARLLDLPLVQVLGARCGSVAVYGSGGFTTYPDGKLREQLAGWVSAGCRAVKMKVGADPSADPRRIAAARQVIADAELYVDANGAFEARQALALARMFPEAGVTWFEEPVSSDNLEGLSFVRAHAPAGVEIVAGEYGYTHFYFRRMLEAGAVDVLQADATRCGGITGFMAAAAIADAFMVPLSAHTAPALHLHPACAAARVKNVEWFHDHARLERMFFEGVPSIRGGTIEPDLSRPGLGLDLRLSDIQPFRI